MFVVLVAGTIAMVWGFVSTWLTRLLELDHMHTTADMFLHLEGAEFTKAWWPAFTESRRW